VSEQQLDQQDGRKPGERERLDADDHEAEIR
jgi:hypothetical protein